MSARPAPVLLFVTAAWTAAVVAAPIFGWTFVYATAHLVCHQMPARTFHLASGPVAVCARCLGLYLGAVAGGGFVLLRGREASRTYAAASARTLIAAAAIPTVLTLAGEWFFGWPVGNLARFFAALPLGAAAAWLVVQALEVDWRA